MVDSPPSWLETEFPHHTVSMQLCTESHFIKPWLNCSNVFQNFVGCQTNYHDVMELQSEFTCIKSLLFMLIFIKLL